MAAVIIRDNVYTYKGVDVYTLIDLFNVCVYCQYLLDAKNEYPAIKSDPCKTTFLAKNYVFVLLLFVFRTALRSFIGLCNRFEYLSGLCSVVKTSVGTYVNKKHSRKTKLFCYTIIKQVVFSRSLNVHRYTIMQIVC